MPPLDPKQFQGVDGEWSLVAMLLVALSSAVAAGIILFRLRDKERAEDIAAMAVEIKELKSELHDCQKTHIETHKQVAELAMQLRMSNARNQF